MKAVFCAALVFAAHTVGYAADTAYTALRVIGKQMGAESLNRVVEVRGRFGAPQPEVWKVVMRDGGARGGLREVEVQRGKIISERTPTAREVTTVMNFNQLNLDSDGAFTVVNQEAQKDRVAFDRVDFALRSGGQGAPVWQVELFDGRNGRVGAFDISADSGAVVHKQLEGSRATAQVRESDRAFLEEDRRRDDADLDREDERGGPASQPGGFLGKVKRHFQKRGRQFENFFTGRGWSDEH